MEQQFILQLTPQRTAPLFYKNGFLNIAGVPHKAQIIPPIPESHEYRGYSTSKKRIPALSTVLFNYNQQDLRLRQAYVAQINQIFAPQIARASEFLKLLGVSNPLFTPNDYLPDECIKLWWAHLFLPACASSDLTILPVDHFIKLLNQVELTPAKKAFAEYSDRFYNLNIREGFVVFDPAQPDPQPNCFPHIERARALFAYLLRNYMSNLPPSLKPAFALRVCQLYTNPNHARYHVAARLASLILTFLFDHKANGMGPDFIRTMVQSMLYGAPATLSEHEKVQFLLQFNDVEGLHDALFC